MDIIIENQIVILTGMNMVLNKKVDGITSMIGVLKVMYIQE